MEPTCIRVTDRLKPCGLEPEDRRAQGAIYSFLLLFGVIGAWLFQNFERRIIDIIFFLSLSHLFKVYYVSKLERKPQFSGLDGPLYYIKIREALGGPNWHKGDCYPKFFRPLIRVWGIIYLGLYLLLYPANWPAYLAFVLSFFYLVCVNKHCFSESNNDSIQLAVMLSGLLLLEVFYSKNFISTH